jgi:hypothetical protein
MDKIAVVLTHQFLIRWRRLARADAQGRTILLSLVLFILTYRYLGFCGRIAEQARGGHGSLVLFHFLAIPLVLAAGLFICNGRGKQLLDEPQLAKCLSLGEYAAALILSRLTSPVLLWSCGILIWGALKVQGLRSPLGLAVLLNYMAGWFLALLSVKYAVRLAAVGKWIVLFFFVASAASFNIEAVLAFGRSVAASGSTAQKGKGFAGMGIWTGAWSLLFSMVSLCVFTVVAKRYQTHSRKERSSGTGMTILKGDLPTKYGVLIKKEIKERFRLLDVYVLVALAVLYTDYLLAEKIVSRFTFNFYASLSLALVFNSFCNIFGSETGGGVERYKLLPLKGKELLLLKNGILFALYTLAMLPDMILYLIRCGGKPFLFGLIGYLSQMFLYFMLGNRLSTKWPRKNSAFKMSQMTNTNYAANSLLGLAIIVVSNMLILNAERIGGLVGAGAALVLLAVVVFAWRHLLEAQGKSLEHGMRYDWTYSVFENG